MIAARIRAKPAIDPMTMPAIGPVDKAGFGEAIDERLVRLAVADGVCDVAEGIGNVTDGIGREVMVVVNKDEVVVET